MDDILHWFEKLNWNLYFDSNGGRTKTRRPLSTGIFPPYTKTGKGEVRNPSKLWLPEISSSEISTPEIPSSVITFYKRRIFSNLLAIILLLSLNNYRVLLSLTTFSYGFERKSFGPCSFSLPPDTSSFLSPNTKLFRHLGQKLPQFFDDFLTIKQTFTLGK